MQTKQSRGKEVREVVGVGRPRKRVDLSKEFNEFKQRIQEFENKNEEIISRIRDAYTVKKKAVQEYPVPVYPSAHVYPSTVYPSAPQFAPHGYHHNEAESEASSCDYSQDVVFEGHMVGARSIYNDQRQNQSAQQLPSGQPLRGPHQLTYDDYMRTEATRMRTEEDRPSASQDPTFSGRFGTGEPKESHLEEQRRQAMHRNEELEELLQKREADLARAQASEGKLRAALACFRRNVEDGLECFQEEVMGQRFLEMEKYIRRCELRLKNLGLRLRDSLEQRRARRLIVRSRSKRNSVSKPRNKQSSLSQEAESTPKASRAYSQSKCRKGDNPSKHREFEQIALDYESMIKAKTAEVEALERRLSEETRAKDTFGNELLRAKSALDEKERELVELRKRKPTKEREDDGKEAREGRELRERLVRTEEELRAKEGREKELGQTVVRLEKAKKSLHQQYSENINKNKSLKTRAVQQLEGRLRQLQATGAKQAGQLRERLAGTEKRLMEKECELLTVANRLKKCENEVAIKEEKLRELEGLLLRDHDHGDLLDRSVSIDTSMLSHAEVRHLQDTLRKVEEELEEHKALIYDLQKEKYMLEAWKRDAEAQSAAQLKTNSALEQRVFELGRDLEECELEGGRGMQRQLSEKEDLLEELEGERQLLLEEKQQLSTRNTELMEELKRAKENNLAVNRELIKLNSELAFARSEQTNMESKLTKAKDEASALKAKLQEMREQRSEREGKLQAEAVQLRQEVENLRNHLLEAETLGNRSPLDKEEDILLNSLHVSEISFNYHPAKPNDEDPAALRERLREVEAALEIKAGMEEKVQAEYRANLDRLRLETAERQREMEEMRGELEGARAEAERVRGARRSQESFEQLKVEVYEEKIMQMEEEYNALKESEERLNDMLHQILETIKQREEDKDRLLHEMEDKDRLLEEMRELLEVRDRAELGKTNKSDTLRDFSLRVSGDHSEEFNDVAELSYLSNISEAFKKDDLLQERIRRGRTGREEQAKLFARTAAYIRSLKAIIEGKDKRIKLLEKQLTSLRAQEGHSWSDREHSGSRQYRTEEVEDVDECDEFKDYDSVQLDTRRSKYTELVKVLQNEKNLAVQENKLLNKQIESLQDELQRSEEQENSLVRIKDLYKDEIKKLIEKNEIHTKQFDTQIHKLKEQLEASESFHNMEAIRQLFLKIVPTAACLDDPSAKPARREEKRKELEEYVKVMSSILQLEVGTRDRLLACLKR